MFAHKRFLHYIESFSWIELYLLTSQRNSSNSGLQRLRRSNKDFPLKIYNSRSRIHFEKPWKWWGPGTWLNFILPIEFVDASACPKVALEETYIMSYTTNNHKVKNKIRSGCKFFLFLTASCPIFFLVILSKIIHPPPSSFWCTYLLFVPSSIYLAEFVHPDQSNAQHFID